jgi:hypothetical protein
MSSLVGLGLLYFVSNGNSPKVDTIDSLEASLVSPNKNTNIESSLPLKHEIIELSDKTQSHESILTRAHNNLNYSKTRNNVTAQDIEDKHIPIVTLIIKDNIHHIHSLVLSGHHSLSDFNKFNLMNLFCYSSFIPLIHLNLNHMNLANDSAMALNNNFQWMPNLRGIYLGGNGGLSKNVRSQLLKSILKYDQLTHLELGGTQLDHDDFNMLSEKWRYSIQYPLTVFSICDNNIEDEKDQINLVQSLANLKQLTTLDLSGTNLNSIAMDELALTVVHTKNLTNLNLNDTPFQDKLKDINSLIKINQLKNINLKNDKAKSIIH